MKLKVKKSLLRGGKRYNEGDLIELSEIVAQNWIKKGLAEKPTKKKNKESKESFETKELKVDQIESKENDGN